MTLKQIKQKMLDYTDLYNGDIPDTDAIIQAKNKKQLAAIIEKHRHLLEDMLCDAKRDLDDFKESLGLTLL